MRDRPSINGDRVMAEYLMRTPYSPPTQVTTGSSKEINAPGGRFAPLTSPRPICSRDAAHERTHSRFNATDKSYPTNGHMERRTRTQHSHRQHYDSNHTSDTFGYRSKRNQHNYDEHQWKTTSTAKQKDHSCCTIL